MICRMRFHKHTVYAFHSNPYTRRALHLCCVILNHCVNALWNYVNKVWGARNLNAIKQRVGSASNTYCIKDWGCCKSGVTPSQTTNAQWRGCGKSGVDNIALINNVTAIQIEATVKIGNGFDVDLHGFVNSLSAIPPVADLDQS